VSWTVYDEIEWQDLVAKTRPGHWFGTRVPVLAEVAAAVPIDRRRELLTALRKARAPHHTDSTPDWLAYEALVRKEHQAARRRLVAATLDDGLTPLARQKLEELKKSLPAWRRTLGHEPSIRYAAVKLEVGRDALTEWIERGWTADTDWQPSRKPKKPAI
jgi:hypothetical protein